MEPSAHHSGEGKEMPWTGIFVICGFGTQLRSELQILAEAPLTASPEVGHTQNSVGFAFTVI